MPTSNFISCFINQVETSPDKTAIEFAGKFITYKELYDESVGVCNYLNANSPEENYIGLDPVGGFRDYSNIIGIWLFGAAYVPINSYYSKETADQIMADLGIVTVLSGNNEKSNDKRKKAFYGRVKDDQHQKAALDLAYVIHTSGSTGKPKSVLISHENVNAFTDHYLDKSTYDFVKEDRFLQSYEMSFDVSVFCFTIPLMIGATLVLPEDRGVKYMTILSSIIKDKITVCSNVPSVAKYACPRINELSMDTLRYCFFSGESLYGSWAKGWMNAAKNAQVYNCYGPTETTIVCTTEHLNILDSAYLESEEPLPLGTSFDSMELKLVADEIHFKGAQVFSGYGKGADGTTFIKKNKFFPTGDMAVIDENGKLIFKGRKDEQIQIDGYRVELGAVDALIQKQFNVFTKTIVLDHAVKRDEIITIVEENIESNEIEASMLFDYIKDQMPSYSLPSTILKIQSFPMNINEKLDVMALKNWVIKNLRAKRD